MNWITNSVLPKIKAWVKSDSSSKNLWIKCPSCEQMLFEKDFKETFYCCTTCEYHSFMPPMERFNLYYGIDNFEILQTRTQIDDPLKFKDSKKYPDRLKAARLKTKNDDAILIAYGKIGNIKLISVALNFQFMGGSMGRAVGDGIILAAEESIKRNASLLVIPSSGGARMQEGIFSLMQLPRTIIAIEKIKTAKLPYIVLLTNPTMGGVTASFSMLGDIHIAEPNALIGFAGRRVIEETVREKLPENFQKAEYLRDHGMVDMVVPRSEQRETIINILSILTKNIEK